MTMGRSTFFAVAGLAFALVGGVGGLLVRLIWPAPILHTTFGVGPTALVAIAALGITWSSVGALLVVRRAENPVGRILIVVGAGHAISVLTVAVAFAALAEGTRAGREIASGAGALTSLLTPILMLVFYLGFIFPTGRGHTPLWDSIGRTCLWFMMSLATLLILQPGDVHLLPGIPNPVGFGPDLRLVFGDQVVGGVSVVATFIVLPPLSMSMALRYREAGRIERQQLKWFFLATSLTIGTVVVLYTVATVTQDPIGETPLTVFAVALTTVPVAIGIAILRYHLYDIDRIISRTISYTTLGTEDGDLASVLITAEGVKDYTFSIAQENPDRRRWCRLPPGVVRGAAAVGRGPWRQQPLDHGGQHACGACPLPAATAASPVGGRPALRPGPLRRAAHRRCVRGGSTERRRHR